MYFFYYTSGFQYYSGVCTHQGSRCWYISPSDMEENDLLVWDSGIIL